MRVGWIVLAAGASTRMGRPKQLLRWNGRSLIQHAVEEACGCESGPVVAVLGANAGIIGDELYSLPAKVITNPEWASGMGSSIVCGVRALLQKDLSLDGIGVLLCDQPLVTASDLQILKYQMEHSAAEAAAADHQGSPGPPAIFAATLFPRLLRLPAHVGAKSLLQSVYTETFTIPPAWLDVDSPSDLVALNLFP